MQDIQDIYDRICALVRTSWVQPTIYRKGFAKMIAEKGIPTNGVYRDRNLNADVGAETHPHMSHWYNKMKPKVLQHAQHSNRLVPQFLEEIETSIAKSSADEWLKNSAVEALRFAREEISTAFDILALELDTALTDCYFHFTT
jgi:hypothetical protein